MKTCSACSTQKSTDQFHRNRAKPDGLATECKDCARRRVAAHRQQHRDEINAKKRAYHEEHREEINAAKRGDRQSILIRERAFRAASPHVGWRAHYLERARKNGTVPVVEDFTRADVIKAYGDTCAHCGGPFEELDHYPIPVAHGGDHTLKNVRPSCTSCNRKAARFAGYGAPITPALDEEATA